MMYEHLAMVQHATAWRVRGAGWNRRGYLTDRTRDVPLPDRARARSWERTLATGRFRPRLCENASHRLN